MREQRQLLDDGKITLLQYRVRTARIIEQLQSARGKRPRYAIS